MRSPDATAAVRAFVAAGAAPSDPANVARRSFVKICGVADVGSVACRDSGRGRRLGLNLVPGTPRALSLPEAAELAAAVRAVTTRSGAATPRGDHGGRLGRRSRRDRRGSRPRRDPAQRRRAGRNRRHRRPRRSGRCCTCRPTAGRHRGGGVADRRARPGFLAAGAERLLLDTAGGPHPGGTGQRASTALAAAVARELPVTLAGGLTPANVAGALRDVPAVGVDVASGVEFPREPGRRPVKDPFPSRSSSSAPVPRETTGRTSRSVRRP